MLFGEKSIVNSFVYGDFNETRIVFFTETLDSLLDSRNFNFHDELNLGFTNTVSEENNKLWKLSFFLAEGFQGFSHKVAHAIDDFLSHKILNMRYGCVFREILVMGSTKSNNTLLGFSSIMVDISTDKHSVFWKTFRALNNPKRVS